MPPVSAWGPLLERALAEDLGGGDVTSNLTLAEDLRIDAVIEELDAFVGRRKREIAAAA